MLLHALNNTIGGEFFSPIFTGAAVAQLARIYNSTGGSVLIVMLAHAMNNTIGGAFFSLMFNGGDAVRQAWLVAILWSVVALVVVLATNMYTSPVNDSRRAPIPGKA